MKRTLYKFIFTKIFKWKAVGTIPENVKKCVIIAVPHTSWWDFLLGIFSRTIIDREIGFVAKKELFVFPFNYFFTWTGGRALDRSKGQNKVDAIAEVFNNHEVFRLALSPEGTRKKVTEWKTGFYYIALKANVPIVPVAFDYGKKEVVYHEPFYPTNDLEADLKILHAYFKDVKGKIPENGLIK